MLSCSNDVMIVGEPSLMGGDFGEEDERLITRLENNQFDLQQQQQIKHQQQLQRSNSFQQQQQQQLPPLPPPPQSDLHQVVFIVVKYKYCVIKKRLDISIFEIF